MIGAFVQGVEVADRTYAGGWFDWLSPFTILCGFALVAGYALLGASWLVMKTGGDLQARMRSLQLPLGVLRKRDAIPFLLTLGLFAVSFAGLAASLYPHLIPPDVTFRRAANADGSLRFMLVGALIMLPVILAYTGYNYWVFRGKLREGEGYH